jgi:ubiquinone/menaquinone biosynthesis C-methylase UbiE
VWWDERGGGMTTDYDPIAQQYKRSKLQPWRTHIESYALMALVGNLSGKTVVDVACGDGYYTRLLRASGASKVRGVDLSARMVELARAQEAERPLGIEYLVGDARDLGLAPEHDVAVAAYLLNYARDRAEIGAMCRSLARCLKLGGRFVTVNQSATLDVRSAPSYRTYGFETTAAGEWREGTPITWTFYLDDGPFSIENYHLDAATHEEELRSAGFTEVRWHAARLSPEGESAYGREFWATFLARSPISFIECVK